MNELTLGQATHRKRSLQKPPSPKQLATSAVYETVMTDYDREST